jgi:hypothetical protein
MSKNIQIFIFNIRNNDDILKLDIIKDKFENSKNWKK